MSDKTELQTRIEKEGCAFLELDPEISDSVLILIKGGIETFASCEGTSNRHTYPVPTIRFGWGAGGAAGFKALSVAIEHNLPVDALRHVWSIENDMPIGPFWEMTFFAEEKKPNEPN